MRDESTVNRNLKEVNGEVETFHVLLLVQSIKNPGGKRNEKL